MADEFWAQLVSVTDLYSSPVLITNDKFVIGRNEDCDISFAGNKLVSGKHCSIERVDGKVWLYDTSTNGTLLNMKTKVSKGNRHELLHGDEIHVVYKKNAQEENIGYLFQDKYLLEKESQDEATQDYSYDNDATLSDEAVNQLNESTISEGSDNNPPSKRKMPQEVKGSVPSKKQKTDTDKKKIVTTKSETKAANDTAKASTSKDVTNKAAVPEEDDMLVTLSCIICQDILHDCISLQPCMHSFCSGCYSEWMEQSNECPSCRMKVDRINKNHLVNNLVEAYLKANPGLKRSEADLKELDDKNKITRDMLYPDRPPTGIDSYSGSDNEDEDDEENDDDDDEEDAGTGRFGGFHLNTPFLFGNPGIGYQNNPRCKQCPNYVAPTGILPQRPQADPNDEDAKVFPPVPNYRCQPNQNHVLCLCCMLPMPDRRRDYVDGGTLPPMQCTFCLRSFCHSYWGCEVAHCNGCIGKLKDLNFGQRCLTSLVLDNAYETKILKDYLANQNMSVKNLLAQCLAKMVTGEYTCVNQEKLTYGINTPLCYPCGFQMFKDLAYNFRKDIPNDELPAVATKRPNCYWGKNCRTQRNKPEHAQRFNHICEQTRTV